MTLLLRNIDAFSEVLFNDGPAVALEYLNKGVPHRYTAIYRFDDNLLRKDTSSHQRPSPSGFSTR